jgi:hypothetical protein
MTMRGMTPREDELAGALIRVMKLALVERDVKIRELETQYAALQREVLRLKDRPVPQWHGTFDHAKNYAPGALVRWGRKVYICRMPGTGIVPGGAGLSPHMWDVFSEEGRQGKSGEVSR